MNWVHRDLKPANIMISLKPLRVTIIDFDKATPRTQDTLGTRKGSPSYTFEGTQVRDGSTHWDVWAIASMILEADLAPGEYDSVLTERAVRDKAK